MKEIISNIVIATVLFMVSVQSVGSTMVHKDRMVVSTTTVTSSHYGKPTERACTAQCRKECKCCCKKHTKMCRSHRYNKYGVCVKCHLTKKQIRAIERRHACRK